MDKIPGWDFLNQNDDIVLKYNQILDYLNLETNNGNIYFPSRDLLLRAFSETPFSELKVVILGQDPYHSEGQANGLAFSVNKDCPIPASLLNIFKELASDIGDHKFKTGDLVPWARQGVLLLNSVLSVRKGDPGSHYFLNWEFITDRVISYISENKQGIVFILWGQKAKKKINLINGQKHFIITSPHPSPLSSYRGFFGSKPFSRTNEYLVKNNKEPINWFF